MNSSSACCVLAVSIACIVFAGSSPDAAPAPPVERSNRTLRATTGGAIEAEAGTVLVPENRSAATSRSIPVSYLRLRARTKAPRAPLFFLAGGPGNRGIADDPGSLDSWVPMLEVSDVVLIDQRGTADPALGWRWDGLPPLGYFTSADSARRHAARMGARAAEVFRGRGVDLAGYTTLESVTDLETIREALGLDRISILAFSYGTHLACAYLRAHSDHVENAVLIGVEGPDDTMKLPWSMDTQFAKLSGMVAADPALRERIPDLTALYDRVIAKLARAPMVIPIPVANGDSLGIPIGPFGLQVILRADIGDANDLPVFPRLLWSIDRGDPSVLAWFVRKRAGIAVGVAGMTSAMDAASGASPARRLAIAEQSKSSRFADAVNLPPDQLTATWNVPDLGDGFRAPLVSPVRTLLLSGRLDFNAPPYQAEHLRWGLANSTHLVVENAGHEQVFFQNRSALQVVRDFLAGADVRDRRIVHPRLRFIPLEGRDAVVKHPSVP